MNAEIPLAEQLRRFEDGFGAALADLIRDLDSGAYRTYIRGLARERLKEGFGLYGDDAYRWGAACRQRNIDEEVADALVYGTTGPT